MSKSIFKILFVLTLFPSINFANHSYNYQVQLSEVCTKEDGYLYYSDGEDLSSGSDFTSSVNWRVVSTSFFSSGEEVL